MLLTQIQQLTFYHSLYIYIYFLNHLRVSRDFRVFFLNVLEFFYITTVQCKGLRKPSIYNKTIISFTVLIQFSCLNSVMSSYVFFPQSRIKSRVTHCVLLLCILDNGTSSSVSVFFDLNIFEESRSVILLNMVQFV